MIIDWKRCAEPQPDGHDTEVAWHFVTTTTSPRRRALHRRRLPHGAPTIFDGAVAVRYLAEHPPGYPENVNGPLQHPNLDQAVELARRWPEAYRQFQRLMDSFHPMVCVTIPTSEWGVRLGSNSHSDEDRFGTMYGTIFDPVGLAEAFMHEMAHHKLRALGVDVEAAVRIVANPPDELYESPIRKDRMRPMTAVLHAQYSFIYVTQMDLAMIAGESDDAWRQKMLLLLSANVPRMELGFDELRRHLQVDLIGKQFIDGFYAWSERVLDEGNALLARYGVEKAPAARVFS